MAKSAIAMAMPFSDRRVVRRIMAGLRLLEVRKRAVPYRDLRLGDRLDRRRDLRVGIREIRLDRHAHLRNGGALADREGRRRAARHELDGRVAAVEVPEGEAGRGD